MPSRDGVKCVMGEVTAESPVQFHEHTKGHWLTCAKNIIDLETEFRGRIRMLPGDVEWVGARDKHKLTAPAGPAKYSCIGLEGF